MSDDSGKPHGSALLLQRACFRYKTATRIFYALHSRIFPTSHRYLYSSFSFPFLFQANRYSIVSLRFSAAFRSLSTMRPHAGHMKVLSESFSPFFTCPQEWQVFEEAKNLSTILTSMPCSLHFLMSLSLNM